MVEDFVIRAKLSYDEDFLKTCIVLLYKRQEADEQATHSTHHDNGVGFNKSDSSILTQYAEAISQGLPLSQQQMKDAGRRMQKYSKQLINYLSPEEME